MSLVLGIPKQYLETFSGDGSVFFTASCLNGVFHLFLSRASQMPFQTYSSVAFGTTTMAIGVSILLNRRSSPCNRVATEGGNLSVEKLSGRFDVRASLQGVAMLLNTIMVIPGKA